MSCDIQLDTGRGGWAGRLQKMVPKIAHLKGSRMASSSAIRER
jgi:hypothetical protein